MADEASSGRPAFGTIVCRRPPLPSMQRRVCISSNRPRRKVKLSAGYYGCTSSDRGRRASANAVRTRSEARFLPAAAAEERDRRSGRQTGTEGATADQRELNIVFTRRSVGEIEGGGGREKAEASPLCTRSAAGGMIITLVRHHLRRCLPLRLWKQCTGRMGARPSMRGEGVRGSFRQKELLRERKRKIKKRRMI